jgi:hypothetical protein
MTSTLAYYNAGTVAVNSSVVGLAPGPNPTTSINSASVANFYDTGSLARFENKNISLYSEKRSSQLQRWRCSCKFECRRIGSWMDVAVPPYVRPASDVEHGLGAGDRHALLPLQLELAHLT